MSLTKKELFPDSESFMINGTNLVATVISEAISCKKFPTIPRSAGAIVTKVTELYKETFDKVSDDFYCREFASVTALEEWLRANLLCIREIEDLNLSNREYKAGITVGNPNRGNLMFVSALQHPTPEDDCVDLGAYIRNVAHELVRNCVEVNFSSFVPAKVERPKTIAVDFDDTLFTNAWPEVGEPIYSTIFKLLEEQRNGAKIILWTNRVGEPLEKAVAACAKEGIKFDAVNEGLPENFEHFGTDSRKIFAHEFWDDRAVPMPPVAPGDISDGYHTFNELYEHRAMLFSVICHQNPTMAWQSKLHNDGTMFDNMFIVGLRTPEGDITYHINNRWLGLFEGVRELPFALPFDGYTHRHVLGRLWGFGRHIKEENANGKW